MTRLTQAEKTRLTRDRLKKSALRAFAHKGVHGTGIEEIARGAGYSKGAFYGNYSSKLELLLDALEEKQIVEVRFWNDVMKTAGNPEEGLTALSKRYVDSEEIVERTLLSTELQLEADRNPELQDVFKTYLDGLYAEIRALLTVMLERHGKAPPEAMDTVVVTIRMLGLGLGSRTILGHDIGERKSPLDIILGFLRGVIAAAPPLEQARD